MIVEWFGMPRQPKGCFGRLRDAECNYAGMRGDLRHARREARRKHNVAKECFSYVCRSRISVSLRLHVEMPKNPILRNQWALGLKRALNTYLFNVQKLQYMCWRQELVWEGLRKRVGCKFLSAYCISSYVGAVCLCLMAHFSIYNCKLKPSDVILSVRR